MIRFSDLLKNLGECVANGDIESARISFDKILENMTLNKFNAFLEDFNIPSDFSSAKKTLIDYFKGVELETLRGYISFNDDYETNLKKFIIISLLDGKDNEFYSWLDDFYIYEYQKNRNDNQLCGKYSIKLQELRASRTYSGDSRIKGIVDKMFGIDLIADYSGISLQLYGLFDSKEKDLVIKELDARIHDCDLSRDDLGRLRLFALKCAIMNDDGVNVVLYYFNILELYLMRFQGTTDLYNCKEVIATLIYKCLFYSSHYGNCLSERDICRLFDKCKCPIILNPFRTCDVFANLSPNLRKLGSSLYKNNHQGNKVEYIKEKKNRPSSIFRRLRLREKITRLISSLGYDQNAGFRR